jgi:hypothetical protein
MRACGGVEALFVVIENITTRSLKIGLALLFSMVETKHNNNKEIMLLKKYALQHLVGHEQ